MSDKPSVRVKRVEDEENQFIRIAEPILYPNENIVGVQYNINVINKVNADVKQINEVHNMRYFFKPEIEELLKYNGLRLVDCFDCYTLQTIDTGWISSEGAFVKLLEEGNEVIMPTFTIISCAAALVRRKIKPVLVDVDPTTWNMDVTQIEDKVTWKTRAIMAVHLYGLPVDMDAVMEIAQRHHLYVIEDSAEAHGLEYKGKMCGSFGTISCMSFYPNKHITTGEGGMVLVDDEQLRDRCISLRNLCHSPHRRFYHEDLGYNFRMSNIQAALGVAQLEKLKEHLEMKRTIGADYQERLKDIDCVQLPVKRTKYAENIYWIFGMVIHKDILMDAKEVMLQLADRKVGCRPFFYPMHLQPVFRKMGLFLEENYPIAERLAEKGFYIPSGLGVTAEQREYVAEQLKTVFEV